MPCCSSSTLLWRTIFNVGDHGQRHAPPGHGGLRSLFTCMNFLVVEKLEGEINSGGWGEAVSRCDDFFQALSPGH